MQDDWSVDYYETTFERSFGDLGEYEQAVLVAAVENVLTKYGIDICQGEWGKPLKQGLYEFRVRKSLHAILEQHGSPGAAERFGGGKYARPVLIRAFCTFHGSKVVLLLSVYDKGQDPSPKRQAKEIKAARQALRDWQDQQ